MPNRKKEDGVPIVVRYGTMWARNKTNIARLPRAREAGIGVYILLDGSMPMYAGKGNIRLRIKEACKSKRRRNMWDHFSWYVIKNSRLLHDIEALMLRILPPNLRSLTRQSGNFVEAKRIKEANRNADWISRKYARIANKKSS
jgi:hypothetical protein